MFTGSYAVVGAGAVGLYYGGRLARAGHEVHFLARNDYAHLKSQGLQVASWQGDFAIPPGEIRVHDSPEKMPRVDVVLVALKATAQADYERLVRPLIRDNTQIICMQNGFGNEERFAELFGKDRVSGGIAYTCINRVGPGDVRHTSHGHVRVGRFAAPSDDRLRQIAQSMKESKIDVEVVDDLHHYRWDKLVWNIPFNGLGAALDLHSAALLASAAGEQLVRDVMAEVIRAANQCGAHIDLKSIEMQIARTRDMGDYHSSMQLDRRARREMEIQAILGEPIRRAKNAGLTSLPALEQLYASLQAVQGSILTRPRDR